MLLEERRYRTRARLHAEPGALVFARRQRLAQTREELGGRLDLAGANLAATHALHLADDRRCACRQCHEEGVAQSLAIDGRCRLDDLMAQLREQFCRVFHGIGAFLMHAVPEQRAFRKCDPQHAWVAFDLFGVGPLRGRRHVGGTDIAPQRRVQQAGAVAHAHGHGMPLHQAAPLLALVGAHRGAPA